MAHFSNQSNKKKAHNIIEKQLSNIKAIFSPNHIDLIARETKFTLRSSKISAYNFLLTMLLESLDMSHSSLQKMCDTLKKLTHKKQIAPQSLMERINSTESVNFLKKVYENALKEKFSKLSEVPAELLCNFSKVLLQDSSTINLNERLHKEFKGSGGRSSKSAVKLDVIYDYKGKNYEYIKVTDQKEADQQLAVNIFDCLTENNLVIRDLGYLNVANLINIISRNAFYLSRLRSDTLVFLNEDDENPIDIFEHISKNYKYFNVIDLEVFITAKKLKTRLVVYKAPLEVVNERHRVARATAKKQGRTLREKTLRQMNFTIFITNVTKEIWKTEVIGTIYRIRWQIELIFKNWKSKINIDYLKGINPNRIKCLIYIHLILAFFINSIYKLADLLAIRFLEKNISMSKVYNWIKNPERLLKLIKGKTSEWEKRTFLDTVSKAMCMQKRTRKNTLEQVCEGVYFGVQEVLA